ncbi:MAG: glycosyltransferase family 2 protein [Prolixibacteraceae bacterium]|nr:glycosyltransferase family 2 protein [Burkholderiales bacterium]
MNNSMPAVPGPRYLVLIPSYNAGGKALETVRAVRETGEPVCVVIDGSTDGSREQIMQLAQSDPELTVLTLALNSGKGAAILHGLRDALARGFTHVLTMDSDGQHPASMIPEFLATSRANPDALILGKPIFDHTAPIERIIGRKLSNWWVNVETLHAGIGDSLFGMRVYPAQPLLEVMESKRSMRRFDFDAEAAVRLVWRGLRPINLATPVRYFHAEEGGVSHYRYLRDNLLLTRMLLRLFCGFLLRLPVLLIRRFRSGAGAGNEIRAQ